VCMAARSAKQSGCTECVPAMVVEAAVQAEHRLNLARQIEKMATENRLPVFSYKRSPT